jgi:hypothetical protein
MVTSSHIIPLYEPKVNITRAAEQKLARLLRLGDRFSLDVVSLCLAQGEEVDSELGAGVGVEGAGLVVVDAAGVEVVVGVGERTMGVGVGGGGVGMGMMKKTILKTTIRLRTQKAIWRDLTCDLRVPRFTAYLLVGWQFVTRLPLLRHYYCGTGGTVPSLAPIIP